jgi:hypothetical protein
VQPKPKKEDVGPCSHIGDTPSRRRELVGNETGGGEEREAAICQVCARYF